MYKRQRLTIAFALAEKKLPDDPVIAASIAERSLEEAGRYLGLPLAGVVVSEVNPKAAANIRQLIDGYLPVSQGFG